ncbi:MAG: phenylalanine--tRNA ligase subunit alpha [Candidatus Micrarchaeia archaeon]
MLHQYEKLVLLSLRKGEKNIDELARDTQLGRDSVSRACYWLKEKGAVEIHERKEIGFKLGEEGRRFLQNGFPEFNLIKKLSEGKGIEEFTDEERKIGLPWAKRNGWVVVKDGKLQLTENGKKALKEGHAEQVLLKKISEGAALQESALSLLLKRGDVLRKVESKQISCVLTAEGRKLADKISAEKVQEVNVLTKEQIVTGKWRKLKLREYEVEMPVERYFPGKKHPLERMRERIRRIFIEMGFEEMEDRLIESSFWNFDALFQPQDHPARDLMDTFYLSAPERIPLPKDDVVERVRKVHEEKWKYKWSKELAEQAILRTHDTAISPQYMVEIRNGKRKAPAKLFTVGRVYRNEATDFKHLSEFHQVGGIIVYEDATFRDLLGLLKEFYNKLGFERIRFRPSYFPYTEPSVEIEVYYEEKNQWLELGGAGVFRPEVCLPTWGKYPVLAWGLSLERPTMLMMDLKDIRMFYKNDISWLREARV